MESLLAVASFFCTITVVMKDSTHNDLETKMTFDLQDAKFKPFTWVLSNIIVRFVNIISKVDGDLMKAFNTLFEYVNPPVDEKPKTKKVKMIHKGGSEEVDLTGDNDEVADKLFMYLSPEQIRKLACRAQIPADDF